MIGDDPNAPDYPGRAPTMLALPPAWWTSVPTWLWITLALSALIALGALSQGAASLSRRARGRRIRSARRRARRATLEAELAAL